MILILFSRYSHSEMVQQAEKSLCISTRDVTYDSALVGRGCICSHLWTIIARGKRYDTQDRLLMIGGSIGAALFLGFAWVSTAFVASGGGMGTASMAMN
jgi:hypothetical protein